MKNPKGDVKIEIDVEVIDKPTAPEGPLNITEVTSHSALLSWKPPSDDGGSPITFYIVEKKDVLSGDWVLVKLIWFTNFKKENF